MHENKSEFQAAFDAGESSKIDIFKIDEVPHASIPIGRKLESLEHLMQYPIRIRAKIQCSDIVGFNQYIESFKVQGSRIYVDDGAFSFTTIFDGHRREQADWNEHRATLKLEHSKEWLVFNQQNECKFDPYDFAEFVEENIEYIETENDLSGADLLTMAQSFKIKPKGEIEAEESLHSGLKTVLIKDESMLRGQNSQGAEVVFPEKIAFKLRVFKNQHTYPIKAFFRYRIRDNKLSFMYKIPNIDGIIEAAFNDVVEDVRKETGLPLLYGKFISIN